MCRIGRGRVTAGGKNHPVPGGMLETAENLRRDFSDLAQRAGRTCAAARMRRAGARAGKRRCSTTRSCR